MEIADVSTPVVVLHCELGALSIMRTLGYLGIPVYGVTNSRAASAIKSRYCQKVFQYQYDQVESDRFAQYLADLRSEFSKNPILLATSDETAIVVAKHYGALSDHYLIAQNSGDIVESLADKMTMFALAERFDLPSPRTQLPKTLEEAELCSREVTYPVMLKGAMGNRLYARTGKKMVVVNSPSELLEQYKLLQDPEVPNLMVQELIPGEDDQVFIFNGYFDSNSECVAAYTGRKIRQFPVHVGCASLGECCWIEEVAEITTTFMKKIGYRGILDIGYRRDPRDQKYKVLDINPRVGQAFRIFVSENDLDVVRAMYLDLTEQELAYSPPREGRRWIIEDYDITSTVDYFQEGSLKFGEWLRSYRRVEECAWFAIRDPLPFIYMLGRFFKQFVRWVGNKLSRSSAREQQSPAS